ncbi:hypothetical protein SAMN05660461_2815 [Chitinophaga ginsengisegetis]|uniref:Uncharacterized protein n=1 Tax=Chitinophaga ginsengisegetis TaxID=393003 RepID=A0A1T5NVM6_9BACT|nr:hypothetical protein [Chitinophaga ginsengisegetis]SKD04323.1 hypothetical protein SAMN05660461_2815 [Chitinophaga ginsengisegetis]
MKQAKLALTAVALLAVVGGALAFKANRIAKTFYSYGTTTVAGEEKIGCVLPITLTLTPVAAGGFVTTLYSSTFNDATTTCTARVTTNA